MIEGARLWDNEGFMTRMTTLLFIALATLCVACDAGTQEDADSDLKAQVRAELEADDRKSDDTSDPCEDMGWYDDGLCDWFCPKPDSDCGPCDYPSITCAVDEIPVDTNKTGCADVCEPNPDYRAPNQFELGELCEYEDDCVEGAYCVKQAGRCDDGEPGVCVAIPECPPVSEFYIDFVCACGGETFANAEDAQCAGFNLDHAGECEAE